MREHFTSGELEPLAKPIVLLLLLGTFLLPLAHADLGQPTNGQQLFFDDFVSSQFPIQWGIAGSGQIPQQGNITESNGYLVMTSPNNAITFCCYYNTLIIANNVDPIYKAPLTNQTQFTETIFRLQAFNMTNIVARSTTITGINPSTMPVCAEIQIGLESSLSGGGGTRPIHAVYFDIVSCTLQLSSVLGASFPASKQMIMLGDTCLVNNCSNLIDPAVQTSPPVTGILYSTAFDLNQLHIFKLQMQLNTGDNSTVYARYQVDSNAWMILNQKACGCLVGNSGQTLQTLRPFIVESIFIPGQAGPGSVVLSQSQALQVDYVQVTNYAVANLPSGQLLSSNINPPLHNLGIYQPGGFSLAQYIQFQANEIGQGNIYAGGLFLTGIFILIITLGLAGVMWKTRMGFSVFGMIWNISTLAFIYLMYYTGVIPLIIPVLVTIGAAAIMFGIFRSGPPSMGGEVPS